MGCCLLVGERACLGRDVVGYPAAGTKPSQQRKLPLPLYMSWQKRTPSGLWKYM